MSTLSCSPIITVFTLFPVVGQALSTSLDTDNQSLSLVWFLIVTHTQIKKLQFKLKIVLRNHWSWQLFEIPTYVVLDAYVQKFKKSLVMAVFVIIYCLNYDSMSHTCFFAKVLLRQSLYATVSVVPPKNVNKSSKFEERTGTRHINLV